MDSYPLRWVRAALFAFALVATSVSHAQLTYTNNPAWNGTSGAIGLGEGSLFETWGQTFVADTTNTFMDSFTFHVSWQSGGDSRLAGYVAEWDGAKITGPILYSSAMRTIAAGATGFQTLTFDTDGLSLTGGSQYVAFLSVSDFLNGVNDGVRMGYAGSSFAGGKYVVAHNGSDFSLLASQDWVSQSDFDWAFTMEFSRAGPTGSVVPEPSTYTMIGAMALLALVGIRRFRRA